MHVEATDEAVLVRRPADALARVYVEPTNAGNLDCRTCVRHVWAEPLGMMEADVFAKVLEGVRATRPVPEVFFGGFGEPPGHPRIRDMVTAAGAAGARTELITNGVLLDETMARGLMDAGLDMLWVSLDGATPESYADVRLGHELPRIIDNLKTLRRMRWSAGSRTPQLGVAFVAMKRNIHDLPAVVALGDVTSASDWSSVVDRKRREPLDTCPFVVRGSTSVRWDGQIGPCLPLLHTHDSYLDKTLRRNHEYFVGSLRDSSLRDLWEGAGYVRLRERLLEFDFPPCTSCNSCELAEADLEDCYGSPAPACGECLWAQGFVRCP